MLPSAQELAITLTCQFISAEQHQVLYNALAESPCVDCYLPEYLIIWQATLLHIRGRVRGEQHNLIPQSLSSQLDQVPHVLLIMGVPNEPIFILQLQPTSSFMWQE